MGDDVNDIPLLRRVGLSAAPADAFPEVLSAVRFVSRFPGGRGRRPGALRAHPLGARAGLARERRPLVQADPPDPPDLGHPRRPLAGPVPPVPADLGARGPRWAGPPGGSGGATGSSRSPTWPSPSPRSPRRSGAPSRGGTFLHYGHGAAEAAQIGPHRPPARRATSPSPGTARRCSAGRARPARGSSSSPATWGAGSCWPGASSGPACRPSSSRRAAGTGASTTWSRPSACGGGGAHALPGGPRRRPDAAQGAAGRQGARDPHRPGHQGAERLRAVLRPPGVHARAPRPTWRCGSGARSSWAGRGAGDRRRATGTSSRSNRSRTTRPRPTRRPRPPDHRRLHGTDGACHPSSPRPSGSGCIGAGRPSRRNRSSFRPTQG